MPYGPSSIILPHTEFHGSTQPILSDPGKVSMDLTALATCTAVWKIRADYWFNLPQLLSAHPIFTTLFMEKTEFSLQGSFAVATCNYVGFITAIYPDTTPIYELTISNGEVPIATHPKFAQFAGNASAPLNGAIFECQGPGTLAGTRVFAGGQGTSSPSSVQNPSAYTFVGFQSVVNGTANTTWAGLLAYLDPFATWKKTVALQTPTQDIFSIGAIDTPPGPVPQLPPNRNWLYMGMTQTQRANVWQTVQEWRLSGRNGWNTTLYAF